MILLIVLIGLSLFPVTRTEAELDIKIIQTLKGLVREDVQQLNWTKIEEGPFLLHYYRGSQKDIYLIREAYKKVLPKLESYLGFKLKEKVIVLIFPDERSINNYLEAEYRGYGFSGFSFPDKMTVVVPLVGETAPADFVAVHELSHLLLGKLLLPGKPPLFFDEGLASYLGSNYIISPYRMEIPGDFKSLALTEGFIPLQAAAAVEDLGQVPAEDVSLFYIEAMSFTDFFFREFGEVKFTRLLDALRNGSALPEALKSTTGLTTEQIDLKWRAKLAGYDEASAAGIISSLPEYELPGQGFRLDGIGSVLIAGGLILAAGAFLNYYLKRK